MKVIIIEDEKLSADLLIRILHKVDSDIEIVTVLDSVKNSIDAFEKGLKADLIFLDIHLADGLSFELFSKISIDTPIVFTTAYSEYAIKAFEVNSVDYLLKPISVDDVRKSIEKYNRYNKEQHHQLLEGITTSFQQITKQFKNRFMVKVGAHIESIKVDDVVHFTSNDGLTFLVRNNGKRYPIDYTMDQVEGMLSPTDFFRINRKTLLSIHSIQKVSPHFNSRLVVNSPYLDGDAAVVSRERVQEFKQWLDQ